VRTRQPRLGPAGPQPGGGHELRIYLVEDHPVMRQALAEFLGFARGVTVTGAAASAEEALASLAEVDANVILVDLSLPGMNGIDLVSAIRARRPDLACVVYTGHGQSHYVAEALAAGARGYLLKGDPEDLLTGLRRIARGEMYVTSSLRRGESVD